MATTNIEHYFYEGRKGKTGLAGPGILIVDGKHKFRVNQSNKERTIFKMYCVQQGNPEFGCKAKATVVSRDDGSFFLYSCDLDHNHLVNKAAIIAEELKQKMTELVKKDPATPVGQAIKDIKLEAAEEFGDTDDTFYEIIDALGSHHAMEQRLLRVRDSIIGIMPRNRDRFDPNYFLKRVFGDTKVEVLDSNKLADNWQEITSKANAKTNYYWDRLSEEMRMHEDKEEDDNEEQVEDREEHQDQEFVEQNNDGETIQEKEEENEGPEEPPSSKNLPKRILAFTSKKLLNLFAKCERGSLDDTFKSCCKLWKQQFVWMVKFNHHWIPAVWGWLPDKSQISYKVN